MILNARPLGLHDTIREWDEYWIVRPHRLDPINYEIRWQSDDVGWPAFDLIRQQGAMVWQRAYEAIS